MTTINEHKKIVQEFIDDINEKMKANLVVERQKIIGFVSSEASCNLFAIYLHKKNLISPGFNMNHRFFASKNRAEKIFDYKFPRKQEILDKLIKQEELRNILCYGRDKKGSIVNSAIENLFSLKKIIEESIGEEI